MPDGATAGMRMLKLRGVSDRWRDRDFSPAAYESLETAANRRGCASAPHPTGRATKPPAALPVGRSSLRRRGARAGGKRIAAVADELPLLLDATGYRAMLRQSGAETTEDWLKNLQELLTIAGSFDMPANRRGNGTDLPPKSARRVWHVCKPQPMPAENDTGTCTSLMRPLFALIRTPVALVTSKAP